MRKESKAFHKFLLLWAGGFVSAIGGGLTSFGLGVYVFQQTGKASAGSIITLLGFLPTLILEPIAGVLSDRYDRRLQMILGDGLSAIGVGFILVYILRGNAQLWHIAVGVVISSTFSSLLAPAYKATITDLLDEEEYTKASGFVQISNSAKFLVSPMLAGYLLLKADITLLLIIDICTIFVTVLSTLAVRKGLTTKKNINTGSFMLEFKDGWHAITKNKGIFTLIAMSSMISFSLGFIQTLASPMILSFTNSEDLGKGMTISALGMLASSLFMGFFPTKQKYVKVLCTSLFFAGLFMAGFGMRENMIIICFFGFTFFAMLPFANASLDYLIRTNIDNIVQGRVWGLIGLISQLGYIVAYGIAGPLADYVFTPLFLENGALASSVGRFIGIGNGRGIGFLVMLAGLLLSITVLILYRIKSVRELERRNLSVSHSYAG